MLTWTCRGIGPAPSPRCWYPRDSAARGRPGRDDHQPVRRRNDSAGHPGIIWPRPSAPSRCHETGQQDHRPDQRGGAGLAAPAAGVSLPGDSGWTRSWSRSATGPMSPTGPRISPLGWTWTGSSMCWGSGCRPMRGRSSGPGCAPVPAQPRRPRGVLIVCRGGLTGFPEAIEATWPQATAPDLRSAPGSGLPHGSCPTRTARGVCAALRPTLPGRQRGGRPGVALAAFEASELGQRYPAADTGLHRRLGEEHCQAPGFVEAVLSGAGGCRLGLVGGLLADVHGLGLGFGLGLGDGVGVVWWRWCRCRLVGCRPARARSGRACRWRSEAGRCPTSCTHSAVANSTSSMPSQGPWESR